MDKERSNEESAQIESISTLMTQGFLGVARQNRPIILRLESKMVKDILGASSSAIKNGRYVVNRDYQGMNDWEIEDNY